MKLGNTMRPFEKMISFCEMQSVPSDEVLKLIANHMLLKLKQYKSLINSRFAELSKALDPCIRSDVIVDACLLWSHVHGVTETFEAQ